MLEPKTCTRDLVLDILQRWPGQWISGEDLALNCGISRQAVNKHINALRSSGHVIKGRPNVGYMYSGKVVPPNSIQPGT